MAQTFFKYQGTGNDFILFDNRTSFFNKTDKSLIARLCDRKFGIGADGLMLLEKHEKLDFKMVYFNSDGNESTMCGNGGRCIVAFAFHLGIGGKKMEFEAIDGYHRAQLINDIVSIEMIPVNHIELYETHVFMNTGSPHHIELVDNISEVDVINQGSKIRFGAPYFDKGTNVNFISKLNTESWCIRTYERGVENETLSCGTGVTAAALALHKLGLIESNHLKLETQGGLLEVSFEMDSEGYKNIWLSGPAKFVFKGEISW